MKGIPLRTLPPRERRHLMALVSQSEHAPFDYIVLEYTLMGRALYLPPVEMPIAANNAIALKALEQVGIAVIGHRPVPHRSGSERQLLLTRAPTPLHPSPRDR